MKALQWFWFTFFATVTPEREAAQKLQRAELDLVEHEAALEYYQASVPMLKARIARIKGERREANEVHRGVMGAPSVPREQRTIEETAASQLANASIEGASRRSRSPRVPVTA